MEELEEYILDSDTIEITDEFFGQGPYSFTMKGNLLSTEEPHEEMAESDRQMAAVLRRRIDIDDDILDEISAKGAKHGLVPRTSRSTRTPVTIRSDKSDVLFSLRASPRVSTSEEISPRPPKKKVPRVEKEVIIKMFCFQCELPSVAHQLVHFIDVSRRDDLHVPILGIYFGSDDLVGIVTPYFPHSFSRFVFGSSITPTIRFSMLLRLAESLSQIHAVGFSHGRLHVDNVFVRDDGTVILCDHGYGLIEDVLLINRGKEEEIEMAKEFIPGMVVPLLEKYKICSCFYTSNRDMVFKRLVFLPPEYDIEPIRDVGERNSVFRRPTTPGGSAPRSSSSLSSTLSHTSHKPSHPGSFSPSSSVSVGQTAKYGSFLPHFIAPKPYSPSFDMFSLGMIFLHVMSESVPFASCLESEKQTKFFQGRAVVRQLLRNNQFPFLQLVGGEFDCCVLVSGPSHLRYTCDTVCELLKGLLRDEVENARAVCPSLSHIVASVASNAGILRMFDNEILSNPLQLSSFLILLQSGVVPLTALQIRTPFTNPATLFHSLRYVPRLRRMSIDLSDGTDLNIFADELQFLTRLKSLKIDLLRKVHTDEDDILAVLKEMEQLHEIDDFCFSFTGGMRNAFPRVSKHLVSSISSFKHLVSLHIAAFAVDTFGLADCLRDLEGIQSVILEDIDISSSSILIDALKCSKNLKELRIKRCTLIDLFPRKAKTSSTEGKKKKMLSSASELIKKAKHNAKMKRLKHVIPPLEILDLSDSRLDCESVLTILELFKPYEHLHTLCLKGCKLLDLPSFPLGSVFAKMPSLKVLSLARAGIESVDDLVEIIRAIRGIQYLDLSAITVGTQIYEVFATLRGMRFLKTLILDECTLESFSVRTFSRVVPVLPALTRLSFSGNRGVEYKDLHSLIIAVGRCKELRCLRVTRAHLGDSLVPGLLESVRKIPILRRVDIQCNDLTKKTMEHFDIYMKHYKRHLLVDLRTNSFFVNDGERIGYDNGAILEFAIGDEWFSNKYL
ncbi:Leucine-rich repeat-containing protein 31 like protein [Aduncisulcus paluster]|uniref:Leucine-rich repeat-containing protein 31 like protein n=1 Tax=Aduncisulcus paluster TaxID=2918883 RepID=A0ABQ5KTD1_9EUKA|nr:Leucine-rich repeat-containing protein 31 like protein [Aduncisulcus paluster]